MNLATDVTDRVCNLECVQDGKVHEFIGPVKIVLMDPPANEYCHNIWGSAFLQLANMMIGAVALIVILFTMSFKLSLINNLHVLLCTVGLQVCVPSGILMCHNLNGASAPLKIADRKCQHFFLEVIGVGCGIAGGVFVFLFGETSEGKFSLHFYAGAVTGILAIATCLSGPITLLVNEHSLFAGFFRKSHLLFGIPAFIASSVCFILGVKKPIFSQWVPLQDMLYALMACCVFYTVAVSFTPTKKFLSKVPVEQEN